MNCQLYFNTVFIQKPFICNVFNNFNRRVKCVGQKKALSLLSAA